jgi:hypothetical protein
VAIVNRAETAAGWRLALVGKGQERQARPLVVGCSTETGSNAGKVFLRASSSASSWRLGLCGLPCSVRGLDD